MRTVATNHLGYPEIRNIQDLPFEKYQVVKKFNLFKIPDHLAFKLKGVTSELYHNNHFSLNTSECDLYHLFNGISWNKKPWVSTFETFLPRYRKYEAYWNKHSDFWSKKGVSLMASDSCKQLIGISNNSKEIQSSILHKYYPDFAEAIIPKIEVIHPQQGLKVQDYSEKNLKDEISFTLASPDFFNKGGREILRNFDRILSKRKDVILHLVSTLQYGDRHTESTLEDYQEAKRVIAKYPKNIIQYDYLPNDELLQLFRDTHIHFRTSFLDTYGFSVLEAQANGCPVISTDVRALGEINSADAGFIIKVPKDEYGNGLIKTAAERKTFSEAIDSQLEKILDQILTSPNIIEEKGIKAIEKIKTEHNPILKAQQLEKIYDRALT